MSLYSSTLFKSYEPTASMSMVTKTWNNVLYGHTSSIAAIHKFDIVKQQVNKEQYNINQIAFQLRISNSTYKLGNIMNLIAEVS